MAALAGAGGRGRHRLPRLHHRRLDAPGDRTLQLASTFGGAGTIRGDLTPECATTVRAVLEALGKKADPEDDRTEGQRFHDALQLACASEPRVRRVSELQAGRSAVPFRPFRPFRYGRAAAGRPCAG
jgi:hypothetical protein